MNTLPTAIPAINENKASISPDSPETYDNLYAKKDYGTLDYPVNARRLDLRKSYMNWIRWHWHEEMEIILVDEGVAEVSTDDASYLIKPGQGLIVNQNVMHCIHAPNEKKLYFPFPSLSSGFYFWPQKQLSAGGISSSDAELSAF